uniref:uncharacterized protein LOC117703451 n=1 Tax=Arvicanthis niloticus TaxID=61156 RepID=UPI0014867222|nr:uncharacterized protein LOC117703451 [Arvicanthis niloticus]
MFSRLLRLFRKENGDQGETTPSKKEAGLLSCKKGRLKSFWERHNSARQTSSQNSTISNQKEMTKLEELKLKIKKMSFEEEEISQMLNLYNYNDLNYRMNIEFDIIKRNHKKTIMNIQKMMESIIDAMEKYKELIEENHSYSTRHCQLLRECSQLKDNVRVLLQTENRNLLVEQMNHKCPMEKIRASVRRPTRTSVSRVPSISSPAETQTSFRPGQDLPPRELLYEVH